ncbi:MAG: dTDP-4-dehydrorhamnose 3,5-epimerase family protein [Actinobacteria bacterium]|nr:dTDP-4-dehydrorhamnose 3,5-epimerase family protein [Actinomycetota bacterium]
MEVRELAVAGSWEFVPQTFPDDRGAFLEWFKADVFEQSTGRRLELRQANQSISRPGVVRGVHFAAVPPGQAKYVYCPAGAALDFVVDIRTGSPTFGRHDVVRLDAVDRRAVFLSEGLGHAFVALEANTVVTYLCSTGYNPSREFGIDPLDRDLDLPWPAGVELVLSDKDRAAPSLGEAENRGLLPSMAACEAFIDATFRLTNS